MKILIDADGCPVVNLALKVGKERGIACVIFCDTSHEFERVGVETVTVSTGADSADFALVNRALPGDLVITQDYGLAAMCLAKRAVPLSQDGMIYSNDNMDALLLQRHTAKKIRMSGGRMKGNPRRTAGQDVKFETILRGLLED